MVTPDSIITRLIKQKNNPIIRIYWALIDPNATFVIPPKTHWPSVFANTTLQSIINAKFSKQKFRHCYENRLSKTIQTIPHNLYHIDVEAGVGVPKSTIAETGMGVTSRPYRTRPNEFWKNSTIWTRDRDPRYPKGVPWDQNFFFKNSLMQSKWGLCS